MRNFPHLRYRQVAQMRQVNEIVRWGQPTSLSIGRVPQILRAVLRPADTGRLDLARNFLVRAITLTTKEIHHDEPDEPDGPDGPDGPDRPDRPDADHPTSRSTLPPAPGRLPGSERPPRPSTLVQLAPFPRPPAVHHLLSCSSRRPSRFPRPAFADRCSSGRRPPRGPLRGSQHSSALAAKDVNTCANSRASVGVNSCARRSPSNRTRMTASS